MEGPLLFPNEKVSAEEVDVNDTDFPKFVLVPVGGVASLRKAKGFGLAGSVPDDEKDDGFPNGESVAGGAVVSFRKAKGFGSVGAKSFEPVLLKNKDSGSWSSESAS